MRRLVVLVLARLTCSHFINHWVDEQVAALNSLNSRNELGLVSVPHGRSNGTEFSDGYLLGLDSLERRGNSTSNQTVNETTYDIQLKFRLLAFAVAWAKSGQDTLIGPSSLFRLPVNHFSLRFTTLYPGQPSCRVRIDCAQISSALQDIILETAQPLTEPEEGVLKESLMPYLNSKLDEIKFVMQSELQFICWD